MGATLTSEFFCFDCNKKFHDEDSEINYSQRTKEDLSQDFSVIPLEYLNHCTHKLNDLHKTHRKRKDQCSLLKKALEIQHNNALAASHRQGKAPVYMNLKMKELIEDTHLNRLTNTYYTEISVNNY